MKKFMTSQNTNSDRAFKTGIDIQRLFLEQQSRIYAARSFTNVYLLSVQFVLIKCICPGVPLKQRNIFFIFYQTSILYLKNQVACNLLISYSRYNYRCLNFQNLGVGWLWLSTFINTCLRDYLCGFLFSIAKASKFDIQTLQYVSGKLIPECLV